MLDQGGHNVPLSSTPNYLCFWHFLFHPVHVLAFWSFTWLSAFGAEIAFKSLPRSTSNVGRGVWEILWLIVPKPLQLIHRAFLEAKMLPMGAFSHSVRTAPVITVFTPVTALKTCHL